MCARARTHISTYMACMCERMCAHSGEVHRFIARCPYSGAAELFGSPPGCSVGTSGAAAGCAARRRRARAVAAPTGKSALRARCCCLVAAAARRPPNFLTVLFSGLMPDTRHGWHIGWHALFCMASTSDTNPSSPDLPPHAAHSKAFCHCAAAFVRCFE